MSCRVDQIRRFNFRVCVHVIDTRKFITHSAGENCLSRRYRIGIFVVSIFVFASMLSIPANLLLIVLAQTAFLGAIALAFRQHLPSWPMYIVRSLGIGVVLGAMMDLTLGSHGVFSYLPYGPSAAAVEPKALEGQVLLFNAIGSYGVAAMTIVLLAKFVVAQQPPDYRIYRWLLAPVTVGLTAVLFLSDSTIAIMFAWGILIVCLGEFLAARTGLTGPVLALLANNWPLPLARLWGFSMVLGIAYEIANWVWPFWVWIPNRQLPTIVIESLVVGFGYFVLCHPIVVAWSILNEDSGDTAQISTLKSPSPTLTDTSGSKDPNIDSEAQESPERTSSSREYAITKYCEFQWAALSSTSDALLRGATIYLLIVGALTGFLLTNAADMNDKTKITLIGVAVGATLITSLIASLLSLGYLLGLRTLEASYRELNPAVFSELQLGLFFRRGYLVVLAAVATSFLLALAIASALYFYSAEFQVWILALIGGS